MTGFPQRRKDHAEAQRLFAPRRVRAFAGILAVALVPAQAAGQSLAAGAAVERELHGGEAHGYLVRLEAGDFVEASVEQKGVDVAAALVAPGGATVVEVDSPTGDHGAEVVRAVVEAPGEYRLEVRALDPAPAAGRYEVRLAAARAATARDRDAVEATRLAAEVTKLVGARRWADAVAPGERALALHESAFGAEHLETASVAASLALAYRATGAYPKAEPLYLRALAVREKLLGADHLETASSLNSLGELYRGSGAYAKAEAAYERALAIREKRLGPDDPVTALSLANLGDLYRVRGAYAKAAAAFARALDIRERTLGPAHVATADSLNHLGELYRETGDYAKAEPFYERALAIYEKAGEAYALNTSNIVNNLGMLYGMMGRYGRAEPLLRRALEIKERLLGPDHPYTVTGVNNLATLFFEAGDYASAEPLYERAIAAGERTAGPNHPSLANALGNLGRLYREMGAYAKAELLYERALAIREKAFGPEHPATAASLSLLATLRRARGDAAGAATLYERALAIDEKALGAEHPDTAQVLHHLGGLAWEAGDLERAEQRFERALAIREKALGAEHPDTAATLNNAGLLFRDRRDYERAERLVARAVAISERVNGAEHPDTAQYLHNLAGVYWAMGANAKAVETRARANEARERVLARNLVLGSERRKLDYLKRSAADLDQTISLHVAAVPASPDAARAALETVVRRKGRALDLLVDQLATLRRSAAPEDRALLDRLAASRAELAALTLAGPKAGGAEAHRARLAELEASVEQLETDLAARSARFRSAAPVVSLAAVQRAIPAGAVLVELSTYRPYDPAGRGTGVYGAPRYVAYVLAREGVPRWADLGAAAEVDAAAAGLGEALRNPRRRDARKLARALDERVMRPVRALAGDSRHLLVSPDGALNLVPFAALVDESGRYLVERYTVTYLTSGRDLLRGAPAAAPRQPAVVLAAPDYGPSEAAAAGDAREIMHKAGARLSVDFAEVVFPPLRYAGSEAEAVGRLLDRAVVLKGAAATEGALKHAEGPRVVHLATHGFFLRELRGGDERVENPLLRSGLALAGANARRSGEEDGVLTALEAAGLDLWGTRLVVLSACDTGVGEVAAGEGVYGLRRALVLAGSESQVMSLWPVSDAATRRLMVAYYGGLRRGGGRTEALRRVQLEMLARPATRHPFYWAGFIQSGAWSPVQ